MKNKKNQAGFTLLELLVAIAIVGILASLAVGRYRSYIVESNRNNARTALLLAQQMMERNFLQSSTYTNGLAAGQITSVSNVFGANPAYQISIPNDKTYPLTDTFYTIKATPIGGQADDACGVFTITKTGQKGVISENGVATATLTAAECWR